MMTSWIDCSMFPVKLTTNDAPSTSHAAVIECNQQPKPHLGLALSPAVIAQLELLGRLGLLHHHHS